MATPGGKPENLVPITERSSEEARELGRQGGIKSGEVRREKRLLSQVLGELMIEKTSIETEDGQLLELEGEAFLKEVARRVLKKTDASSVAMLRLILESNEGKKIKAEVSGADGGPILTQSLNAEEAEEFRKRFSELHPTLAQEEKRE